MIDGEAIERAERVLRVTYSFSLNEQFPRMRVDRDGFDKFVAGLVAATRKHYPDLDPRFESALNTMCAHAFLVGVVAGRNSEREIV